MTTAMQLPFNWMFPTAEQWVASALNTVQAHGEGHSAGSAVFEYLIWAQQNMDDIFKPFVDFKIFIFGKNKKTQDPRFEFAVCDEENSPLFQYVLATSPDSFNEKKNK